MKKILLDFETMGPKGPVKNKCTLEVIPPDLENTNAVIQKVSFRDPVKNISYNQLFDLHQQIQGVMSSEEAEFQKMPAVVGDMAGIVKSEKGVKGFGSMLKGMYGANKGKFSKEDQKQIESGFALVEKLLGKK